MPRLIGEAAENGRAVHLHVPRFGDLDLTAAEDHIHAEDHGIARNHGLAEIDIESAENSGDYPAAKLLPIELALPSAEDGGQIQGSGAGCDRYAGPEAARTAPPALTANPVLMVAPREALEQQPHAEGDQHQRPEVPDRKGEEAEVVRQEHRAQAEENGAPQVTAPPGGFQQLHQSDHDEDDRPEVEPVHGGQDVHIAEEEQGPEYDEHNRRDRPPGELPSVVGLGIVQWHASSVGERAQRRLCFSANGGGLPANAGAER